MCPHEEDGKERGQHQCDGADDGADQPGDVVADRDHEEAVRPGRDVADGDRGCKIAVAEHRPLDREVVEQDG